MKKLFILLLLCCSIFLISCAKNNTSERIGENYYRIRIDGKWGFINYEGEIKIPCIYNTASDFEDEICRVSIGKEVFFINKNNERIKTTKKISNNNFDTIVDNSLPKIVPEGFTVARKNPCIGEEMYVVMKKEDEDSIGVIDKDGNFVIEAKLYGVGNFKDGMASFQYGHNGIDGYIRKDGVIFDFSK